VSVTEAVRAAAGRDVISHLSEELGAMVTRVSAGLRSVVGAGPDAKVLLTSTPVTVALESAVRNLVAPGGRLAVLSNGYFGERVGDLGRRLGFTTHHVRGSWSEPLPRATTAADVVVVVHHETSTGYVNDLRAVRDAIGPDPLLVVDATSSAGCLPVAMQDVGADVVVFASHKSLGGPPGVAVTVVAPRAYEHHVRLAPPVFGDEWRRIVTSTERDRPRLLWTPAVSVLAALDASLAELLAIGLSEVWAARAATGRTVRGGLAALGFTPLPAGACDVPPITAAAPPPGVAADDLVRWLDEWLAIQLGGGVGELAGRVVRVTHTGIGPYDCLALLAGLHAAIAAAGAGSAEALAAAVAVVRDELLDAEVRVP
jgi:aspartate aminotransferase-like enzyme